MKKPILWFVLIAFITQPVVVLGEDLCLQSYDLNLGEVAPCWGVLMPQPWVLKGLECIRVDLPYQTKKLELYKKKSHAEMEALKEEIKLTTSVMDNQSLLLDQALESHQPRPWFESPLLWGAVGLVAGIGGTSALVLSLR